MLVWLFALVTVACYLSLGPLPRVLQPINPVASLRLSCVRLLTRTIQDDHIQALWVLHSQILAGTPIDQALLVSFEVGGDAFAVNTRNAITAGRDVSSALLLDATKHRLSCLENLATLYALNRKLGAPIATPLARIIQSEVRTIEQRQALMQELASTKSTIAVLAFLPVVGFILGAAIGVNQFIWLTRSPLGWLCFFVGMALQGGGLLWVRRLIRGIGLH